MKGNLVSKLLLVGLLFLGWSCKSEFEQVRTSEDPDLVYQKAEEYFANGEYQRAQSLYELVISNFRGKKEAEDIYFKYAYTYYHLERYLLAAYYFENFSNTYPTSERREESDYMVAYSNYQLSPSFRLDQTYTQEAIEKFQTFANTYPRSERIPQVNALIDEMRLKQERKFLEEGKLYLDLRQYQAANTSLENLLKDFPDTKRAEEVRFLIIRSGYEYALNSVVTKQDERFGIMLARASSFIQRYPNSEYRSEVERFQKDAQKQLNRLDDVRYQNESSRSRS